MRLTAPFAVTPSSVPSSRGPSPNVMFLLFTYEHLFIYCYDMTISTPNNHHAAADGRLDDGQTADLAEMFRLLGDPTRLSIVLATLPGAIAVSAIARRIGASPSLVSHHLRLLRGARILRAERRGKQVFYSASDAHIRDMLGDMIEHIAEPHEGAG